MTSNKHIVVKYNKVIPSNIKFTDFDEGNNSKIDRTKSAQKIAFPRYSSPETGEGMFNIQTPWTKLDNYGPPKEGTFYPNDKSRSFVKIPLDVNRECKNESEADCEERSIKLQRFKKKLEAIDEYMQTDEMKIKLFGSKKQADKFTYQNIVRKAMQQSGIDSDNEEPNDRPDYFKARFDVDFESEKIKTEVFRKNNEDTEDFVKDGEHTKMNAESLDDICKYIGYMKDIRYVIQANKLWASKRPMKPNDPLTYGLSFKIRRAEVILNNYQANVKDEEEKFIDGSDSESDDDKISMKQSPKMIRNSKDDDDEEESEDGSDEEEVVVKKKPEQVVKKSRSKKVLSTM